VWSNTQSDVAEMHPVSKPEGLNGCNKSNLFHFCLWQLLSGTMDTMDSVCVCVCGHLWISPPAWHTLLCEVFKQPRQNI
jgi:hypothetical protein